MFYRLQSREGWGGMSGQGRLIAREILDPSPAFVSILERYIRPHKDLLISLIADIMQINPGPEKLMSCAISIIGQCLYYAIGATVNRTVFSDTTATMGNLDQLADSVYHFSLGGIAGVKKDFLSSPKAES
jgi:hypothetical protein